MNYGELKAAFKDHLNRSDLTDAQVVQYLKMSFARLQRNLRIPAMERIATYTSTAQAQNVPVPEDLLEIQAIFQNGKPLDPLPVRQFMLQPVVGEPRHYCRIRSSIFFRPYIPADAPLDVLYYGEFSAFTSDADQNELSAIAPDIIMYGALSYAGDFFDHEKTEAWDAKFVTLAEELNNQAQTVDLQGGPQTVQAAYGDY